MNNLMNFEGNSVEIFEWNGQVLFNPRHVAYILNIKNVNDNLRKMSNKQVVKLKNSDIGNTDIRKLNNAGENFLTESGVYKLIFKSRQPAAERFSDWVADDVLPRIRKTGSYEMPEKEKNKKEKLSSVNQMAKNITGLLQEAGVDAKFIAAEVVRIYTDNGYPVHSPVITVGYPLSSNHSFTFSKTLSLYWTVTPSCPFLLYAVLTISSENKSSFWIIADTALSCGFPLVERIPSSFAMDVQSQSLLSSVIEYGLANGKSNNCKVVYDI